MRRTFVILVVGTLQTAGLIRCRRCQIRDLQALEAAAAECHASIRDLSADRAPAGHQALRARVSVCRARSCAQAWTASSNSAGLNGLASVRAAPILLAMPRKSCACPPEDSRKRIPD